MWAPTSQWCYVHHFFPLMKLMKDVASLNVVADEYDDAVADDTAGDVFDAVEFAWS